MKQLQLEQRLSFSDILQKIIPKDFSPVTPGTSFVTVGGAIAARCTRKESP